LSLLELDLGGCAGVSQEAVLDVAKTQPRLRLLGLDLCRRVFADYPATSLLIFQELGGSLRRMSLR